MKKIIVLIIIISFCKLLQAQQQFTKKHQEVHQTVIKMFEALSNRDSVSLKSYCTTDISFYEYGQVWNIDTLIKRGITMNKAADFKRTNTFDFINTIADKKTALVTYRLSSAITKNGKQVTVNWLETVFLVNQKKRWKVKHLHSTLIKNI